MDTRTLLLGDWHPWLRDGIDLLRLSLVAGAVVLAVTGDTSGALLLAAAAVVAFAVRPVLLPRPYDLALVVALVLQAFGEALGTYDAWPAFDVVTHVTLPMLLAPTLYIALARADVVPDPKDETHVRHYIGIFVVAFALGGAFGAVWELYEWTSDALLGTELQLGNADTVGDLAADSLGSLLGAALLVCWARWGWGSVRRVPGENAYEVTEAPR